MISFLLKLVVLGGVFVAALVYVAPSFMPKGVDPLMPNTSAIDHAKEVIDKATGNIPTPAKIEGTVVNLSGRNLTKVAGDIFAIQGVTTLDVSNNNLEGALPGEIRLLSNLRVLDLSDNKFTGVPAEIGQLAELRVLDLSNNPITGLPNELGNLSKLERLDLSGTNYSHQDLATIKEKLGAGVVIVTD
ncbi:MAG: leucine rich repeat containing 40 [Candidatus Parcubacteria bacterium]|jgi:Leucine-rich repeat (LRR) protein